MVFVEGDAGRPQRFSVLGQTAGTPRFSIRRKTPSNLGAVISAIGRCLIHGKMSRSKSRIFLAAWAGARLGENFANHSRATCSKVFAIRSAWADFCALRFWLGPMPRVLTP